LGVTHYTASAYDELEAVMRSETLDFVQLNYSLDDRAAERKLLPLAADRGIAILVNLPFGGGGLLRRLGNRPLPEWAGEMGCTSWAQILLKFVLAHPAVTCVIPGTGNPAALIGRQRLTSCNFCRNFCRWLIREFRAVSDHPISWVFQWCPRGCRRASTSKSDSRASARVARVLASARAVSPPVTPRSSVPFSVPVLSARGG
jgi:hypothetical protein